MQPFVEAQTTPTIIHFHHFWLIWLMFFVGETLHTALQIDSLARSSKISRIVLVRRNAVRIVFRAFLASMAFWFFLGHPEVIGKIPAFLGHPLSDDEISVVTIPINNATAGIFGLFLDSAIGYIPWVKSQLPQID